jgi:hypothetical protein
MIKVPHILEYKPETAKSYASYILKFTVGTKIVLSDNWNVRYDWITNERATAVNHITTLKELLKFKHGTIQEYIDKNNLNFLKDNT